MAVGRDRRAIVGTAAVLLAGLATPVAASAALRPLPVTDLFTSDRVEDVTVAVSPAGDAVVGWTGQNNSPTVLAAYRAGGDAFGPAQTLTTQANGEDPHFVFQPDGTVLAVWSHATTSVPGGWATRPPGNVFGPAQALPSGERFADVGIDSGGVALAVWKSSVANGDDLVVASRRAPGGSFEAPVPLSTPVDDNFIQPQVAVDGAGEAVVGWERSTGGTASVVEARVGSVTGPAFGAVVPLAAESAGDTFLSDPAVAIAPDGEALAVWSRSTATSSVLEYAVRAPGAVAFGAAQPLVSDADDAHVAFDALGTAVIAFRRIEGGAMVPSAIVRPPGGTPGAPTPLGLPTQGGHIASVTFDGSGAALVAWSREAGAGTTLAELARRPAGGAFQPAVAIADMGAGRGLAVSAEPDGDVLAAWRVTVGETPDRVVLRLGGLQDVPDVPVTGAAGSAAPLCAVVAPRRLAGGGGRVRFTLSPRQLLINQRISQAAVRRLNAVEAWLDAGAETRDLCGESIGLADLGAGITATTGGPTVTPARAHPRPIVPPPARRGRPGTVRVTAGQLLINQRISQAAVRRANALQARLRRGLTGGDLRDGQVTAATLAAGIRITTATPQAAPPPAGRTLIAPRRHGATAGRVALTPAQLRVNQRISQAAVRRANGLIDRLATGLTGADFRDGTITAIDLAPELR
jgi:hypothetical protein